MEGLLVTRDVWKVYNQGKPNETVALAGVSLRIKKGDFVAIMGPSGSGKTTLLDIVGCLLKPSSGKVFVDGIDIGKIRDNEIAKIRGEKIGFIFQQYNLISSITALENVEIPMRIMGMGKNQSRKRAEELLGIMGLEKRISHKPPQLSGGEQQRVAISRALANEPKIILGDEVTGNLDSKNGKKILGLLKRLNREKKYTILLVTHDQRVSRYAERIIRLKDGKIAGAAS